jgi:signal transduction histidine kinase
MPLRRPLPLLLLSGLILLPVAVVTVAGFVLLKHERERLENQTSIAQTRLLEQVAADVHLGLQNVQDEMVSELENLPPETKNESLMALRSRHPLIRNVFRVTQSGTRILPPNGLNLDGESLRFLRRYESLFTGRTPWFEASDDRVNPVTQQADNTYQILKSFKGRSSVKGEAAPLPSTRNRVEWRPWQWEDKNGILLYTQYPDTLDVVGIELEMNALYARLDVLLRNLAKSGEPLLLVNREDDTLIASEEPFKDGSTLFVEVGPMLPFARLGMSLPNAQTTGVNGHFFFITASAVGILLILSVVGGTFGLMAWVHRSRREAMQKTSFVSNVSHEFKTPLTTLRLYSELLLEGRVKDEEKQIKYLKTLRNESERLARLVHNVLDFSRLEMNRNRFHPKPLELETLIGGVVDRLSERLLSAGINIRESGTDIEIFSDPDGSDQIVLNLLDNALKYATGASEIHVDARIEHNNVLIRICDDGPGIPLKERKHLFKPFHQVDDRITRESGGTGLGLHISRRLARQMGGDLVYEPCEKGACFLWSTPKTGAKI